MVRVGILNISGYAGAELARILYRHPEAQLTGVTGRSGAGKRLPELFPHLWPLDLPVREELDGPLDLVFSALPHGAAAEAVAPLVHSGVRVVDLSADFRLRDADEYRRWYQVDHPARDLLASAVYGLPELHRAEIALAQLVGNPGCYPTGAVLALAPAVREGLVDGGIIVDAKSGVSGAGRTLSLTHHFSEANEGVAAYGLGGHRHLPEMTQELGALREAPPPRITFVPHLIPMTRGILTTCYADLVPGRLPSGRAAEELRALYRDAYQEEPFVRVLDEPPQTKHTAGSNSCLLYLTVDERAGRLVAVSCLDNLVKGAAGSAVQNMNLMLGLPEATGLQELALYP